MNHFAAQLLELYLKLGGGVILGWILARLLPKSVPSFIGQFLFWLGVPISIVAFIRRTDLSGAIWVAPLAAWIAILLGATLAGIWVKQRGLVQLWTPTTQGSFLIASMFGNTGYIGYPVVLALVGEKYFGWAVFYDLAGTVLGAYGLGVVLGARFGIGATRYGQMLQVIVKNPTLWSFFIGLGLRGIVFPEPVEQGLQKFAWMAIAFSIILIGMRLSGLASWRYWQRAIASLSIKMFAVPLSIGIILLLCGVQGAPLFVLVLQMAMPPAFATLVIAEAYNLDRDLTVTTLAVGSIGLLLILPLWFLLFGV